MPCSAPALDRPVDGAYRDCIERVNRAGLPVLALDIPSGLDADTGLPRGTAIRATRTLAFIALKSGHYLGEAPDHVGALEFAGLDIPAGIRETQRAPVLRRIEAAVAARALPPRRRTAHKGEHGRVLIVGGLAMPGAARLAGEAALRTGAGLVTVATSAEGAADRRRRRPELIVRDSTSGRELASSSKLQTRSRSARDSAPTARRGGAFDAALGAGAPLVVDADALTLLAAAAAQARRLDPDAASRRGRAPARRDIRPSVQRDRLGAVREIAKRYGGTCVLKGANTLVQGAEPVPWVCDRGNPGMATAGSGDVLTGVIAALLAAGAEPALAAAAGVVPARRGGRPRGTRAACAA